MQAVDCSSSTPPAPVVKITRGHSCLLCQQRKVRCDRQKPCTNCIKARAECIPSASIILKRKKRKPTETDLVAKLRRYEHLLQKHGVKIDADDFHGDPTSRERLSPEEYDPASSYNLGMCAPRARNAPKGALFADKENSRYVEKYYPLTPGRWQLFNRLVVLSGTISVTR